MYTSEELIRAFYNGHKNRPTSCPQIQYEDHYENTFAARFTIITRIPIAVPIPLSRRPSMSHSISMHIISSPRPALLQLVVELFRDISSLIV